MINMIKIKETIIVEGKHDKIKLKSVVDANIITTDGFRIYKNKEKQALIRNIAEKTGIIIITDSDTAGRKIRNFIKNCVKSGEGGEDNKDNKNSEKSELDILNIVNIYIPKVPGKEKRKTKASKENLIGVEGTDRDKLLGILNKFGINDTDNTDNTEKKKITKIDFYNDKITGHENSSEKRKYLCDALNIPYMSANSLIETLNILIDYGEYKKIMSEYNNI